MGVAFGLGVGFAAVLAIPVMGLMAVLGTPFAWLVVAGSMIVDVRTRAIGTAYLISFPAGLATSIGVMHWLTGGFGC